MERPDLSWMQGEITRRRSMSNHPRVFSIINRRIEIYRKVTPKVARHLPKFLVTNADSNGAQALTACRNNPSDWYIRYPCQTTSPNSTNIVRLSIFHPTARAIFNIRVVRLPNKSKRFSVIIFIEKEPIAGFTNEHCCWALTSFSVKNSIEMLRSKCSWTTFNCRWCGELSFWRV